MPLTLSLSDNEDGSGGVATIAGADAATVTVYKAAYHGIPNQNLAWTSAGTRSGDGTLAVSGQGLLFWHAAGTVSSAPAISSVVFQALTDQDEESVHKRCLFAIRDRIRGLDLRGIATANIEVCWHPADWKSVVQLPGAIVCPVGKEGQPGVMSGTDDIEYPCLVVLLNRPEGPTKKLNEWTLWRQKGFRALRQQRPAGVPEIINVTVEPANVFDLAKWVPVGDEKLWWSALTAKCRSREVRG